MITLPTKYNTFNNKGKSEPTVLVGVSSGILENEQTTQGDWMANTAETQVDYSSSPGSVLIGSDTIPTSANPVSTNYRYIWELFVANSVSSNGRSQAIQSFYQTTGASKKLETVTVYLGDKQLSDGITSLNCYISTDYDGVNAISSLVSTTLTTSVITSGTAVVIDFTAENVTIEDSTTYFLNVSAVSSSSQFIVISIGGQEDQGAAYGYDLKKVALLGSLPNDGISTGSSLRFIVTYTGGYYLTSGSITTQIIDLGDIPVVDGEFIVEDLTGSQTLTYTLYGSTDAFAASNENLGTFVDGDVITGTDIYRYYKVKADFSSSDKNQTPILQSLKIIFIEYYKFSDTDTLGYDPSLKKLSSLTTEISETGLPTIGQISLTFGRTQVLSNFLYSGYPKNRRIYIKLGFVDPSFTEADYIDFYNGVIDDYDMKDHDVVIKIKDPNLNWKTTIPKNESSAGSQSSGTFTSIVASADHPIDVMIDILQNYLEFRDSLIDFGSFDAVKALLPSWEVTRTITGDDRAAGQTFLNELRFLTGTYFIPDPSGKVKLKLYDDSEAESGSIGLNDFLTEPSWEGNATSIINQTYIEYAWNTGTEVYDRVYVGIDPTSQSNYQDRFEFQYQDKWTLNNAQGNAQMLALTTRILTRFAGPPPKFKCRLDRRNFTYEVADFISVTTRQAPSSDLSGITAETYQIIQKNFNPLSEYVDFTLMKV